MEEQKIVIIEVPLFPIRALISPSRPQVRHIRNQPTCLESTAKCYIKGFFVFLCNNLVDSLIYLFIHGLLSSIRTTFHFIFYSHPLDRLLVHRNSYASIMYDIKNCCP